MEKNRLEAFSDGVLAIVITIMVLEMKVPHGNDFASIKPLVPVFLSYVLSFIYVGIYWINHHHMLQTVEKVNGSILWANLHLLFWLSLFPFVSGWVGENHFTAIPSALYGLVLLMAAFAYAILQHTIIVSQGENSLLAKVVGRDIKGKLTSFLYVVGIVAAFFWPIISGLIYAVVACIWLVPDKRIERLKSRSF
ncbi:MAG: TMEM175 family protein [Methylotenera sp.]|uniref:TMEM175 family protein n=1 Tax=Methylotenera sp. TaxID=2051956 RepID=UPI002489FF17|nr:TMEM175 family protein [Methylotenera sp.]MDI1308527.1 TMEM175 family protein [Methylotenera sp.]